MGSVYTSQTISDYNLNPPDDDGSQTPANQLTWSKHKTKLADPIKALSEAINTQLGTAFAKVQGGVTAVNDDYTVLASDQGKSVVNTGSGKTVTTPDAATVGAPFVFRVQNNHASSDLTVDGSGSQTINGTATITLEAGEGALFDTDGSNWFAVRSKQPDASDILTTDAAFSGQSVDAALAQLDDALAAGLAAAAVIVTGSYTGDGATSMVVSGLGITPKYVHIATQKTTETTLAHMFTTDVIMDDNASGMHVIHADQGEFDQTKINGIIAFGAGSFTVDDAGNDSDPNQNGIVYNFIAIGTPI